MTPVFDVEPLGVCVLRFRALSEDLVVGQVLQDVVKWIRDWEFGHHFTMDYMILTSLNYLIANLYLRQLFRNSLLLLEARSIRWNYTFVALIALVRR